jgi:hypothetical protein
VEIKMPVQTSVRDDVVNEERADLGQLQGVEDAEDGMRDRRVAVVR